MSADRRTGFLILNVGFVLAGCWAYLARVRPAHRSAMTWIWIWVVIEIVNGLGHVAIALARGQYFPGVATAPVLLVIAVCLAASLRHA